MKLILRLPARHIRRAGLLIAIAAAAAGVYGLVRARGFDEAFQLWNVTGYGVPFLDWALITGSAQTVAMGLDPTIQNPGDPGQRLFNYPKIWDIFLRIPMTHRIDVAIGIAIVAIFLLAVAFFPRRATPLSEVLLFLGVLSPAVVLGCDRANVDLLAFAMMVLALALVGRWAMAALAVLLTAVLFKIFPVFGVGMFLSKDRARTVGYIGAAVLGAALYFAVTFKDMVFIFGHTQRGIQVSYGLKVLPDFLAYLAGLSRLRRGPVAFYSLVHASHDILIALPYLPYVVAALLLLLAGYFGLRYRDRSEGEDARNLRAFWMGAAIYVGTFLLGNNWDYRLIFLLLALPQLGEWARAGRQPAKFLSMLTLIVLFESLYELLIERSMAGVFAFGAYYANMLDEAANWALFALLAFLLVSSLPAWIPEGVARLLPRPNPRTDQAGS